MYEWKGVKRIYERGTRVYDERIYERVYKGMSRSRNVWQVPLCLWFCIDVLNDCKGGYMRGYMRGRVLRGYTRGERGYMRGYMRGYIRGCQGAETCGKLHCVFGSALMF